MILALAPETNGHVAVKAWQALVHRPGANIPILALHKEGREDSLSRYSGAAA
ncbi:hypothetical protein ACLB1S_14795 [Escherichia coli]